MCVCVCLDICVVYIDRIERHRNSPRALELKPFTIFLYLGGSDRVDRQLVVQGQMLTHQCHCPTFSLFVDKRLSLSWCSWLVQEQLLWRKRCLG